MRLSVLVHSAILGLIAATGCDSDRGPIGYDQFRAEFDTAACRSLIACGIAPDEAYCKAGFKLSRSREWLTSFAAASAGRAIYDGQAARTCLDAMASTCMFDVVDPACDQMFHGTVPGGSECMADVECITGSCSSHVSIDSCEMGICVPSRKQPVGSDCSADKYACAQGAFCKQGICTAKVSAGEACTPWDECVTGAFCKGLLTEDGAGNVGLNEAGACNAAAATGEPCGLVAGPCIHRGDYCDLTRQVCVGRRSVGESCSESAPCVGWAACISGTCVKLLVEGEACDETRDECTVGLACIEGKCAFLPQVACTR